MKHSAISVSSVIRCNKILPNAYTKPLKWRSHQIVRFVRPRLLVKKYFSNVNCSYQTDSTNIRIPRFIYRSRKIIQIEVQNVPKLYQKSFNPQSILGLTHLPQLRTIRGRPCVLSNMLARSFLVEGDELTDWPKSQTGREQCYACAAYFLWVCHKHNSLPPGPIQPSSPSTKELHVLAH